MAVVVKLQPAQLEVEPGTSRDVVVSIRNETGVVDDFTVIVTGKAADWSSVTPKAVNLFTQEEKEVRVSFAPPRKPEPKAGVVPFGIFVQASTKLDERTHEQGEVTVLPFTDATAELIPQSSRGSRSVEHQVHVMNGGNIDVSVELKPNDPNRRVQFETNPTLLALANGAEGFAKLSVKPNETFRNGPPQSHSFVVNVSSTDQDPFDVHGALLQLALLPSWLPKALAGLLAAGLIVGVLFVTKSPPFNDTPSPSTSEVAGASPTPTPTPTPTPAPTATQSASAPATPPPSAPASVGPTPTPTPGPFELAFAPDANATSGALLPKNGCELQQDSPCYQAAVSTVVGIVGGLGQPYGGAGVVSDDVMTDFGVPTFPILVRRDQPFDWHTVEGAAGETPYVVVDLAPRLADEQSYAYAVVRSQPDDSTVQRFVIQNSLADQLLDALYVQNMPEPTDVPDLPTPGETFDPGVLHFLQNPIGPIIEMQDLVQN